MSAQRVQPRIAIVGGGPGGLTLGLLLHKRNIPFTIFELRNKLTPAELAQPSGMLDLHDVSGLAALKACDLYNDFMPLTGECSENFLIADNNGKIVFGEEEQAEDLSSRPEISRNNLINLLQSNIPADKIKWGQKLVSAGRSITSTDDEVTLDFGVAGEQKFDLVIGADGAWSKIRQLLTDVKPHYSGLQIITLTIKNITTKYPHLAQLVGSGTFTALGKQRGVVSQRGPLDSARLYIFLTQANEHFGTTSGLASRPAVHAESKLFSDDSLLSGWGPMIEDLVLTACKEESADHPGANLDIRPLYTLPVGTSWEHKSGLTLIGDAAHLMLPNGEGVNSAMQDALLLSETIAKAYKIADQNATSFRGVLDPLIEGFEVDMAARASKTGEETKILIENMFGSDGPQNLIDLFTTHLQQTEEKASPTSTVNSQ